MCPASSSAPKDSRTPYGQRSFTARTARHATPGPAAAGGGVRPAPVMGTRPCFLNFSDQGRVRRIFQVLLVLDPRKSGSFPARDETPVRFAVERAFKPAGNIVTRTVSNRRHRLPSMETPVPRTADEEKLRVLARPICGKLGF